MAIWSLKWKCRYLAEPLHPEQPWALTSFLEYYVPAKISAQFLGFSAVAFCLVSWTLTLHSYNIEIGKCIGKGMARRFFLILLFSFLWDFFPSSPSHFGCPKVQSVSPVQEDFCFLLGFCSPKTGAWQVSPGTKPEWIWSLCFSFQGLLSIALLTVALQSTIFSLYSYFWQEDWSDLLWPEMKLYVYLLLIKVVLD